jgi:hypothetical protein
VKPASILNPRHPERVCWGCDKYCPNDDLACGGGTIRTPHPQELFGEGWLEWSQNRGSRPAVSSTSPKADGTMGSARDNDRGDS